MLTHYPNFTKLNISLKNEVEKITNLYDPYSDFNFTSMLCWDFNKNASLSIIGNNLVIKIPDYLTGEDVYSILGKDNIDESIKKLLTITPELKLVPELVVENLQRDKELVVLEDPDNFDYVYYIPEILNLGGKSNKKQRNKLNQFSARYNDFTVKHISPTKDVIHRKYLDIFDDWKTRKADDIEQANERKAIGILLDNLVDLDVIITEIRIDNVVVGFSINEKLNNENAICHFQKYLPNYNNIDTALTFFSSNKLLDEGCKYVNWEQDLGLKGLKRNKNEYKPQKFLKKYTIKLG